MCLGTVGKIVKISGDKKIAVFECLGVKMEASIDFLPNAKIGDYCMLHARVAIAIISEEEAIATEELFKELLDVKE